MSKQPSPSDLFTVDPDGGNLSVIASGSNFSGVLWSPSGDRLLFTSNSYSGAGGPYDFATNIVNADGTQGRRVPGASGGMTWSPNGQGMAYLCEPPTSFPAGRICVADADGNNPLAITSPSTQAMDPRWAPDGSQIAFICGSTLCVVNPDGTGFLTLVSRAGYSSQPRWSPDSKDIAYRCPQGLCAVKPDGTGDRQVVIMPGAIQPSWSPLSRQQ
jgi:Tol biopolymer transport system component